MKKNKLVFLTVALASVIGFKSVNVNAATTYAETLPETVTRNSMSSNYRIMHPGFNTTDGKTNVIIEFLSQDSNYLLYCSDRNNPNIYNDVTLTKGNQMDYKIAYVLTHGYNKQYLLEDGFSEVLEQGSNPGTETAQPRGKDMVNLWITQAAIWNLQNSISSTELNNDPIRYTLSNIGYYKLTSGSGTLSSATLWKKVVDLVNSATNAKDPNTATLSVEGNTNWTKSDNILKTDLLTMASSSDLANIFNYSLSLENAPEGTKIYKEDGTDITNNLNNIDGNTKIYVVVDRSKIDSKKEYVFKLNAKAVAGYDAAYQYVDNIKQCNNEACQPSVLVGPEVREMSNSVELKITPDTASSISNTIYYIGFIILLSGVGIIYANIRPRKQESE